MCGILGGWLTPALRPEHLEMALGTMLHRGPDGAGHLQAGPVFLGMRRLAVIDLEGGEQPIFNEDESVAVIQNGEIYNYRELTRELKGRGHTFRSQSDTEVIAHLYEEHGSDLCRSLHGMFAFAVWDSRERVLLLGRDRLGKKPLFYMQTSGGGLLFASELKALRVLADAARAPLEVSPQAVYDYLSLGVVPQPLTIYQGIRTLMPGHTLKFDGHQLSLSKYWGLDFGRKRRTSFREAVVETRRLVSKAVERRLRSDVPLGAFLSAGVDSSVVAYEASQKLGSNLQTFTVATDDPALDESRQAARTARELGVQNTPLQLRVSPLKELQALVRHYDQPFADSSAIPSLAVSRLARQHVTVILSGDGGDEIFAGYRRYLAIRLTEFLPRRSLPLGRLGRALSLVYQRRRSSLGFAGRFLRGAALGQGDRYLVWLTDMLREPDKQRYWSGTSGLRPTEHWVGSVLSGGLSPVDANQAADIHINMQNDQLVKLDMATMAASLEARSPLLDHELAEFVASLPAEFRLRRGVLKALLREAYRGRLPKEVLTGKKRGFEIPLRAWLEHDFRDLLQDTLGSESARVLSFVRSDLVRELLDHPRHWAERNRPYIVYSLLMLELWLREFT